MLSDENPSVATLSWSKLYSAKPTEESFCFLLPSSSASNPETNLCQKLKLYHISKLGLLFFYCPSNKFVLKNETLSYFKNWVVVFFYWKWLVKWAKKKKKNFVTPLSERLWWFDLIWEGHQHRESLEQRAPIGEKCNQTKTKQASFVSVWSRRKDEVKFLVKGRRKWNTAVFVWEERKKVSGKKVTTFLLVIICVACCYYNELLCQLLPLLFIMHSLTLLLLIIRDIKIQTDPK